MEQVVQWMCDAPARVWDLMGKGRIEIGYDADLVLVDLELTQVVKDETQQTKCGWSPWHGIRLKGWPVRTWVMGREVFRLDAGGAVWFDREASGEEIRFGHERGGFWSRN